MLAFAGPVSKGCMHGHAVQMVRKERNYAFRNKDTGVEIQMRVRFTYIVVELGPTIHNSVLHYQRTSEEVVQFLTLYRRRTLPVSCQRACSV